MLALCPNHTGLKQHLRPPERETAVGNLIETGTLGVGQLLEFHRFLLYFSRSALYFQWEHRSQETMFRGVQLA